jgi:hypothetical protein
VTVPGRSRPATAPLAYAVSAVALGLAASLVLALAACGQPTPSPDDSLPPTVSVPLQPTITADTPTDDAPDPAGTAAPSGGGLFDASSGVTQTTCEQTGETWSFTGTLTNADTREHTFTVGAFIVKVSDGSEVAGKELDVTLAAGATAPVAIKDFHSGPSAGVQCLSGVTVKGL